MVAETHHSEFELTEGPKVLAWKRGVPPQLADLAIFLACDSEPLFHKLNAIRSGKIRIISENIPNLKIWFSYYRCHRRLIMDVNEFFAPYLDEVPQLLSSQEIISQSAPIPEYTDVRSILQSLTPEGNPKLNRLDLDWINSPPALLFFLFVWVPCNCLYGENPPVLLFKARHGDLTAARKLLQLDKSIIAEPGIARKIRRWTAEGRPHKLAVMGSFLGESIPNISLELVKLSWARFILDTSIRAGQRLSAPKIQELFNAIAQDSGIGIQDPDIGEMSPETFAKALSRRKNFWQLSSSK